MEKTIGAALAERKCSRDISTRLGTVAIYAQLYRDFDNTGSAMVWKRYLCCLK